MDSIEDDSDSDDNYKLILVVNLMWLYRLHAWEGLRDSMVFKMWSAGCQADRSRQAHSRAWEAARLGEGPPGGWQHASQ